MFENIRETWWKLQETFNVFKNLGFLFFIYFYQTWLFEKEHLLPFFCNNVRLSKAGVFTFYTKLKLRKSKEL